MIESKRGDLERISNKISIDGVVNVYNQKRLIIDNKLKTILQRTEKKLSEKREAFSKNMAALYSMSPMQVLSRGFSVTQKQDGTTLKTVADVKEGQVMRTVLQDGTIFSQISHIERADHNG